MREIKFRAWDKKRKFFLGAMAFGGSVTPCEDKERTVFLNHHEDIIVMQFTGRKEGGRDIYEGDIVKIGQLKGFYVVVYDVEFAMFRLKSQYSESGYSFSTCSKTIQVVGNIYETPELLT